MTIRYRNKSTDDAAVAKLAYVLLENTNDTLQALSQARINDHMAIKIRRLVEKQRRLASELENCLRQPERDVFMTADDAAEYYRRLMAN
jgi:predicted transcriptional regulator